MSIANTQTFENGVILRTGRKPGKVAIFATVALAAIALIPVATAAFGIARGGVEPYIVLAALVLG